MPIRGSSLIIADEQMVPHAKIESFRPVVFPILRLNSPNDEFNE
jgi:hypothetical protein